MMESMFGEKPLIWGSSIIGFSKYHYSSKGGYEADWFKIGFSPRKAKISICISYDLDEFSDKLERLGRYSRGKGCLYVNKLSDIDMKVLEEMSKIAYENVKDFNASK